MTFLIILVQVLIEILSASIAEFALEPQGSLQILQGEASLDSSQGEDYG